MAIVITNGEYYIYLNEKGKHRKTKNVVQALQYNTVREAINYMYKAPAKTDGFYVYDTFENHVLWKRLSRQEKIELQEQKNGIANVKRRSDGRIRRKKYSKTARTLVYEKYNGRCQLCGRQILLSEMSLDHVKPLSMGGVDDVSNLACTCMPCNRFKANIAPELFENRINDIFMYQTEKNTKHKLKWKIAHRLLLSCIK
ncbi:HNH endonuclease [Roseburia hominis]